MAVRFAQWNLLNREKWKILQNVWDESILLRKDVLIAYHLTRTEDELKVFWYVFINFTKKTAGENVEK